LRLWVKFFVEFFCGEWNDIKQLNLRPFKILKILFANPFKKCIFKHLINNKCIIMSFTNLKKPIPYERERDFIDELCIIF
jgi:hypothetical protein